MSGQIIIELWDDSDWSGLPTSNPGSGKPWLHSSGVICIGGYTPPDLSTKADLVAGKVPSSQLPSYVDDVLEYSSTAAFPGTGETGKIYVALDTNRTYRWSGSAYIELTDQTAVWGSISGTLASQSDLNSAIAAKAADSAVVHTTGAETIAGVKTFSSQIIIGASGQGFIDSTVHARVRVGNVFASLMIGSTGAYLTSGNFFGWSASIQGNSETMVSGITGNGTTVTVQASSGLTVKNAAGSADGPVTASYVTASSAFYGNTLSNTGGSMSIVMPASGYGMYFKSGSTNWLQLDSSARFVVDAPSGMLVNVPISAWSGSNSFAGALSVGGAFTPGPKTFGTLGSASAQTGSIYRVTDRGQKCVQSDGTDWRFIHDNSIAS